MSFYATKMITSGGQGGAIISRNKKLIDNIKDYRSLIIEKTVSLDLISNDRFTGAIGRVQ